VGALTYQLIALDVDGTLLNDHYELTDRTKQIIRQAHDAGCRIVLCTGRGPASTIPILQELGLEGIVVTHNGAATVYTDANEKKLLHQYSFSVNEIQPMLDYVHREHIHFDVSSPFDMYIERMGEYEEMMYKKFLIDPKLVEDVTSLTVPLVKFTLFSQPDVLDRVEREWADQQLFGHLRMIRSGDLFIDVMHASANKGNALKELAAQWQIDAKDVMAIGNYYNDLEMIQFAGLGLAVANSPEGVKAAADAVVPSNNEEGVYEAILRYGNLHSARIPN
jgi:Cof subfamily protein (haloacid dehalogenase superfamily)